MVRESVFENMIAKIAAIKESDKANQEKLTAVCNLLKNNIPDYNWVGFYFVDPGKPDELVLGPFAGEPTEHVRIKFGQGICGQAAERKETFIVEDVSKESNYLACSPMFKSEIVVPIFKDNRIIAELDIDSHAAAAFNQNDEKFLRQVGELVIDLI
jgi:GAF domain-containing protein